MSLDRVNNFLNNMPDNNQKETDIILSGPDTIRNILVNETVKLSKLEQVSNELLNYLTDSKAIKNLSYKEKQSLLHTITDIQVNSRDFIFKVAELSSKNEFLKEILKISQEPTEIVQSESGEVYISSIDETTRKNLSELLRDVVNDRIRS